MTKLEIVCLIIWIVFLVVDIAFIWADFKKQSRGGGGADSDDYGFGRKQARADGVSCVVDLCIKQAPAADVVPVVRCRECAYSDDAWVNEKGFLICPASGMDISGDDFCSYGERREA